MAITSNRLNRATFAALSGVKSGDPSVVDALKDIPLEYLKNSPLCPTIALAAARKGLTEVVEYMLPLVSQHTQLLDEALGQNQLGVVVLLDASLDCAPIKIFDEGFRQKSPELMLYAIDKAVKSDFSDLDVKTIMAAVGRFNDVDFATTVCAKLGPNAVDYSHDALHAAVVVNNPQMIALLLPLTNADQHTNALRALVNQSVRDIRGISDMCGRSIPPMDYLQVFELFVQHNSLSPQQYTAVIEQTLTWQCKDMFELVLPLADLHAENVPNIVFNAVVNNNSSLDWITDHIDTQLCRTYVCEWGDQWDVQTFDKYAAVSLHRRLHAETQSQGVATIRRKM